MAIISVPYVAVTGNSFTPDIFNGLWASATITIQANEIATSMLQNNCVDKTKIAANVAGVGLRQAADGSLAIAGGLPGIVSTILTNQTVTLTVGTSVIDQLFTDGPVSGDCTIVASGTGAANGDGFDLYFKDINTAAGRIIIKSDASTILTIDTVGIVNAYVRVRWNGSAYVVLIKLIDFA